MWGKNDCCWLKLEESSFWGSPRFQCACNMVDQEHFALKVSKV